jgi:16S rRNA (guanine527-N7)-methyltransferase
MFAAMKGMHPYEEIDKLPRDCAVQRVLPLAVPGLEGARHLVLIVKNEAAA